MKGWHEGGPHLDVCGGVLRGFGGDLVVLRGFLEVVCDEPAQFGPALEANHLPGAGLGQALVARLAGEGHGHAARAQQKTNLGTGY